MEIRPYYHPTTIAFVDDSPDFLANLGLTLSPSLAFRVFVSPLDALDTLNSVHANAPGPERFFSVYQDTEELSFDHHVIDLNLARIYREVFNDRRFQRFSVMVVDYDMPEMDGLDLCRRLAHSPIRKILLTGKADKKMAIRAFNEGLIDRYIPKQDPDVPSLLRRAIDDMQNAYFMNVERLMEDALNIGPLHFLRDPFFGEMFRRLCADLKIVEFYLCSSPEGMLLIDDEGNSQLLLVCDDDTMRLHQEIARDGSAPVELQQALDNGDILPYFWRTRGFYSQQYYEWKDYVHPAKECNGLQRYRYALVNEPRGLFLPPVFSYRKHLQYLDQSGAKRHRAS